MGIAINILGELDVQKDGKSILLPRSKRTRALLAYLVLASRPHRRDRLCELLWEIPDDPRGALRWSLSKLRPLVNDDEVKRLIADRERVTLFTDDIQVDLKGIEEAIASDLQCVNTLKSIYKQLSFPLLDGYDLPEQEIYQQWLISERKEKELLQAKVLSSLASHQHLSPPERLSWAKQWEQIEPYNPQAAFQLVELMTLLENKDEALRLKYALEKRFRKVGIPWPDNAHQEQAQPLNKERIKRELLQRQKIQFCTADDGVRIAYATIGKGTPIVKAANWLSHLEHDWESPIWSPLFRQLALDHQFIRYDERGNGLSDWDVETINFECFVKDLESVVEACKVEKFVLLGISQGAAVSIEYAVRYPERVSKLILFGGYAAGWRINASDTICKEREAIITLTKSGWGKDNPAYRQIFSSTFMPSANAEELAWFNEFQRLTTSPDNAVRFLNVFSDIDVRDKLKQVKVPTLVIHSLRDQRIPVDVGREIAASIPQAEFVGLDSDGHLLLGREPASKKFLSVFREFTS